jgi:hypothetical protein
MKRNLTGLGLNRHRSDSGFAVSPGVRASVHEGGLVLLETGKGKGSIFTSNRVGAQIWQRIANGRTPREIAAELSVEYGASRTQIEDDTAAFLGALIDRGIVVYRHPRAEAA